RGLDTQGPQTHDARRGGRVLRAARAAGIRRDALRCAAPDGPNARGRLLVQREIIASMWACHRLTAASSSRSNTAFIVADWLPVATRVPSGVHAVNEPCP